MGKFLSSIWLVLRLKPAFRLLCCGLISPRFSLPTQHTNLRRFAQMGDRLRLHAVPVDLAEANAFVLSHHRHNRPVVGHKFSVGVSDGAELWGVGIAGRPVARLMQDGVTLEVLRCCVRDGAPKGCASFLYGALWRAARALGYLRLITYTLQTESGASLRGAGWKLLAAREPNNPAGWQSRAGREWQPVVGQAKFLWSAA